MVSISQITGSQAAAHRFATVRMRAPDEDAGPRRAARVPERLEQAIARTMSVAAPSPAPVSTPAAEGQTEALAEAASSPEAAGEGFASLLYESLRDAGPQADRAGGNGRGNAYGLERGAGWRGQGWGSLTMRLEALAQRYAATATSTATATATSTAIATAATTTATDTPPVETPAQPPAAVDASDAEATAAAVASPSPTSTDAAPVPAPPPPMDPLLEAYSAMVSIGVGSAAGDAAGLRDFLLEMAAGMRPGGSGSRSLLDLTA